MADQSNSDIDSSTLDFVRSVRYCAEEYREASRLRALAREQNRAFADIASLFEADPQWMSTGQLTLMRAPSPVDITDIA